jgi:hypothetical protein
MLNERLMATSAGLVVAVLLFAVSPCSEVTSVSEERLEQLKEHAIMLDGPGSRMMSEAHPPLWVVNDRVIPGKLLRRLKPKYIDSISILKGNVAVQAYGREGTNGVVKIYAGRKIFTDLQPDAATEKNN